MIDVWIDQDQSGAGWVGWCSRCGSVCVLKTREVHAEFEYNGRYERVATMKPCPMTARVYLGHNDYETIECGGKIMELPNQVELIASWMIGGREAVVVLVEAMNLPHVPVCRYLRVRSDRR